MSKTVRLDDRVHTELEELRLKQETFSETVERLVSLYHQVTKIVWSLPGQHPRTPGQGS